MEIEVFKFGGASIANSESIENVYGILNDQNDAKLLVVLSALGKSTNALEKILNTYFEGDNSTAMQKLASLKDHHFELAKQLMQGEILEQALQVLNDVFIEIEWIIEDDADSNYDFEYDQLVSIGEFASTQLVYHYLKSKGLKVKWLDVRNVIKTDNTYREAKVLWELTEKKINEELDQSFKEYDVIITQGFVGCSSENFNTTLGREGSDFTAAIFSYCLEPGKTVIWKDVDGILSGDPSKLDDVELLTQISYREAIEMTYYGAKVIHPKTIKPIQNKQIPLQVRSFINKECDGTFITANLNTNYPPITVIEENMVLLIITTKDFSFVAEDHLSAIFILMKEFRIKMRIMRNSAISFSLAIINSGERVESLMDSLKDNFEVQKIDKLHLITIRHYNPEIIDRRVAKRKIVLTETYGRTIQLLVETS